MSTPTKSPVSARVPAVGRYVFDPKLSSITFKTRHMFGLGGVTGSFALREGELVVAEPTSKSTMRAVIDAASFTSPDPKRDKTVRSAKLLDVAAHPDITFEAGSIHEGQDGWVAEGNLTVRGETNPVAVTLHETRDGANGPLTLVGTTRLDRHAHGVTAMRGMAGRWLDLTITAVTTTD